MNGTPLSDGVPAVTMTAVGCRVPGTTTSSSAARLLLLLTSGGRGAPAAKMIHHLLVFLILTVHFSRFVYFHHARLTSTIMELARVLGTGVDKMFDSN